MVIGKRQRAHPWLHTQKKSDWLIDLDEQKCIMCDGSRVTCDWGKKIRISAWLFIYIFIFVRYRISQCDVKSVWPLFKLRTFLILVSYRYCKINHRVACIPYVYSLFIIQKAYFLYEKNIYISTAHGNFMFKSNSHSSSWQYFFIHYIFYVAYNMYQSFLFYFLCLCLEY